MTYTTPAPALSGGQLHDHDHAHELHRHANHVRAEALVQVATSQTTVWSVLEAASYSPGKPLLKLSLKQLLLAQVGVGPHTQEARVVSLLKLLGVPMGTSVAHGKNGVPPVTVQWLTDPRVQGQRMLAFIDVMDSRTRRAPAAGFPFSPPTSTDMDVQGDAS